MNEEPLDLRRFTRAVSAGRWVIVAAVVIGALAGAGFAKMQTPQYTSRAVVLLPPAGSGQAGQPARDVKTQVQLASSDVVLVIASQNLRPPLATSTLQKRLVVTAPTDDILVFEGRAGSSNQAIDIANAAADAYRVYSSSNNAFLKPGTTGQAGAPPTDTAVKVISPATTATTSRTRSYVTRVLGGALGGALVGLGLVLRRHSRDRRLRTRSDIAAAAGSPVVASVATLTPGKPSEWLALLEDYQPRPDERWSLRRLLRDLMHASEGASAHVVIVTLRHDTRALAVAPQLASFAASSGVATALVVSGQPAELAALRQAREVANASAALDRPNLAIVGTAPDGSADGAPELVVSMLVVDPAAITISGSAGTTALLAVTTGAAAHEEIASVAAAAAGGDSPLAGVIVVDTEPTGGDEDMDVLVRRPRSAASPPAGKHASGRQQGSVS